MADTCPLTISGPYGQYTVDALVDPDATFTSIPTPALIEMGIEPLRVVRVKGDGDQAHFQQLGRALTTVGGQEDVTPILFGNPGQPSVIGATTLAILLLRWDTGARQMLPIDATSGTTSATRRMTP
jgi:hypothetical protein